ncbi:MAG: undecaprenyl-diphosphate phosphatase [Candidatus Bathyarchaeia archaeon]
MTLKAVVLGVLQGILEWLPISSQGNLMLVMVMFLGIEKTQALSLSIYLHLGTVFSVLFYFRQDVTNLLKALPQYRFRNSSIKENKLITFLLITTIITGLIGYPIFKFAETETINGEVFIAFIGIALIITGLLQKMIPKPGSRTEEDVNFKDILLLGVAQGFSAFPGVSRSGITTFALLFRRFRNQTALKLSFLMSVPAILAAEIGLSLLSGLPKVNVWDITLACVSSFISGLISIHILLKIAQKINFWLFCITIGVLALIPLLGFLL